MEGVTVTDQSNKENIPPASCSANKSESVPVNEPASRKRGFKRFRRPLADVTHLLNNSVLQASSAQEGESILPLSAVKSRKRKVVEENKDAAEGSSAKSLRMGFR